MRRKHWTDTLIPAGSTLGEAIRVIESGALQIGLVVDAERRLVGTITDGDLRRAFLRGLSLDSGLDGVTNPDPVTAGPNDEPAATLRRMTEAGIHRVPRIDAGGRVTGLVLREDLATPSRLDNWVVLMAGGLGLRLRPMTEFTPKPLLKVGRKPLLENTLETLAAAGFRTVFISVNYLAEKIRAHFGDGGRWGVTIRYLEETEPLGTAGALGLLPTPPTRPFIVMNGDLLTNIDYRSLIDYHHDQGAAATLCVREYDFQVPFGVVRLDGQRVAGIVEKPSQSMYVNAGIYVLDPRMLDLMAAGRPADMPDLVARAIERRWEVAAFPVREYWLDIGRVDDFLRAEAEYREVFR